MAQGSDLRARANIVNLFNFSAFTIEREVGGKRQRFWKCDCKSRYNSKIDVLYEMSFVRRELVVSGAVVIECGRTRRRKLTEKPLRGAVSNRAFSCSEAPNLHSGMARNV
jgi:hypothetical protein